MRETSSLSHSASAARRARAGEARAQLETEKAELNISQMSRLYNVTFRTLRSYEDRGLITPRREGHARFYRAADRKRFEMILRGKRLGFTLTEIIDLIGARVEVAASSNAPESLRTWIPPSMVVWTPIGKAWLETLRASAEVEEDRTT